MLVLALEFSRGCTAHAGVGYHAATEQLRSGTTPDRGTHGVRGHPRHTKMRAREQEGRPGSRNSRRARLNTGTDPPPSSHEHQRDVTGIDPKGRSLKTE